MRYKNNIVHYWSVNSICKEVAGQYGISPQHLENCIRRDIKRYLKPYNFLGLKSEPVDIKKFFNTIYKHIIGY